MRVSDWADEAPLEDSLTFRVPPLPSARKPGPDPSAPPPEKHRPWNFPGCGEEGGAARGEEEERHRRKQCAYWGAQVVAAAEREAVNSGARYPKVGDRYPEVGAVPRVSSVAFVHIPRTGTNFITLLRNLLPACYAKHFSCYDMPAALTPEHLPEALLNCSGNLVGCAPDVMHLRPGELSQRFPGHTQVTMLRDPVQRELSSFFFHQAVRGNASGFSDAAVMEFLLEQDAACRLGRAWCLEQHGRNTQTRLLGGGRFAAWQPPSASRPDRRVVDPGLELVLAKQVLASMPFFGLTDRWPETVCVFHCELGVSPPPRHPQRWLPTRPQHCRRVWC